MSEKALILKASINKVLNSETYRNYTLKKKELNDDSKFKMYKFIVNNKNKFSMDVYNRAKLKYVKCESILKDDRKQLDQAFNKLLELYDQY